jgi:hypothetical protein
MNSGIERAVLFGPTIGGAWTIVRWRFYSGLQIVEGLGQPRWITALIVGSISFASMTTLVTTHPSPNGFKFEQDALKWATGVGNSTIHRNQLANVEQTRIFDRISGALARQNKRPTLRYLLTLMPLGLFWLLLYVGKPDDLWQPIGSTGITLVVIELWYRFNA